MKLLRLPSGLTIALSAIAGLLSLLNLTTFGFAEPWQNLVTIGLSALAAVGIAPLTGPALQNAIHLTHATALALASICSTAAVAITTLSIDQTAKGIAAGVLTLVAGVLFGPGVVSTPVEQKAAPVTGPPPPPPAPAATA